MTTLDTDTRQPRRPTLKTIAYMTGLGVTTVSRALHDAPDIGQATKERVRLVARQIGYRPNRAGVRLRTGKTNVISLILTIEHEALAASTQLVHGISEGLADTPYHLIVTPYLRGADPLDPVRYVVETGSADGVIMSRIEPQDARVRYLMQQGLPFATHGRTDMGLDHPYADFDNEAFAGLAVDQLAARRRRRLTLLSPPLTLSYAHHMVNGFQAGVDRHGMIDVPLRTVTTDNTVAEVAAAVERLMRGPNRPDGMICGSANAAIGATAGIEQAGFRLGDGVDIALKESFNLMPQFRPALIVVKENFMLAGQQLARNLVGWIDGVAVDKLQTVEPPSL